jgi:hypothetical protein
LRRNKKMLNIPPEFISLIASLFFAILGLLTKFLIDLKPEDIINANVRFNLFKMLLFTIIIVFILNMDFLNDFFNIQLNIAHILGMDNLDLAGTIINYFWLGFSSKWIMAKLMKVNIFKEGT